MKKNNKYYDFIFEEYLHDRTVFPAQSERMISYRSLLPTSIPQLSLGEGKTALTQSQNLGSVLGYRNLYIKHEEQNPTGSFKDRESFVAISLAQQEGLKEIVIASSGNAALSMAAYARKAKIACKCFVPVSTSIEKKELITFFGGELCEIVGNYEQIYRHVADHFPAKMNMTSGICSKRIEGNKTIAYEIWEEIGVPDVVIVPCGNGGNLAGIWKGFDDLMMLGKISRVPKMVGVQVMGAAPLSQAMVEKKEICIVPNTVESIAEGILAEESYCSPKAIQALRTSEGFMIEVTDIEIRDALQAVILEESLMIEPTSAAAFAALSKLDLNHIPKESKIVVISTGSGMKMLNEIRLCSEGTI